MFSITAFCAVEYVAKTDVIKGDGVEQITMALPTGASVGDLLIAYISKDDNHPIDVHGDWTGKYNNVATGANTLYIAYRIVTQADYDAEPTKNWTWTETSGNEDWMGIIICYTGQKAGNPFHATGISTDTSAAPIAPSVAFSELAAGSMVLQVFGADDDDEPYTVPAQLTSRFNTSQSSDIGGAGGDKIQASGDWVSPTGFNDPEGAWTDEANAYDENTGTFTYTYTATESWSSYLWLTINAISCSKVRFWALVSEGYIETISLDVFYSSGWHTIYEGNYANQEWVEKEIGSTQQVTAMRVKFYNSSTAGNAVLYEVDFFDTTLAGSGNTGTAIFSMNASEEWAAATLVIEATTAAPPVADDVIFFGTNF